MKGLLPWSTVRLRAASTASESDAVRALSVSSVRRGLGLAALLTAAACSSSEVDKLPPGSGGDDAGFPPIVDTGSPPDDAGSPDAEARPDASIMAGEVQLNTDSVDFGGVVVTSTATRILTVTNPNQSPVFVVVSTPSGRDAARFSRSIDAPVRDGGFELAPGQTVEITVAVSPAAVGPLFATLALDSCMGSCPVALTLTAEGIASGVVCPELVDLGFANPGACRTGVVACENRGNLSERITSVELAPMSDAALALSPPALPLDLAPGATADFEVELCPTARGEVRGSLIVLVFEPSEVEHEIALVGRGGGPDLRCTPERLELGRIALSSPTTASLVCENVGFDDATLVVTPDRSGLVAVASAPATLSPGAVERIELTVTPQGLGALMASVLVTSNDPDTPELTVPITAEVIDVVPCTAALSPSRLDFGQVSVGDTRALSLTLSNGGSTDCLIRELAIGSASSAGFGLRGAPAAGSALAAGQSLSFEVTLTPGQEGMFAGTVELAFSNPMTAPLSVALAATAGRSVLVWEPGSLDFGPTPLGCASPVERTVRLRSVARTAIDVTRVEVLTASSAFSITGLPTLPRRLQPLEAIELTVRYTPSAAAAGDVATLGASFAQQMGAVYTMPLAGRGTSQPDRTDRFDFRSPQADVLFVVDDSCSMAQAQAALGAAAGRFAQTLSDRAVDFRVGVVTTDMQSMMRSGRLVGMPTVLEPTTPMFETELAARMQVGTQGSGSEQGVRAAVTAVTEPLVSGPNAGFLRPGAELAIIILSDEEDVSPQPPLVEEQAATLRQAAGTGRLSVSAIVGPATGQPCQGPYGDAQAAPRYAELVLRAGAGVLTSFCDPMEQSLARIAEGLFGGRVLRLSAEPQPSSIQVRFDGNLVPATNAMGQTVWSYDAARQAVVFADGSAPPNGSQVTVDYRVYCLSATCGDGMLDPLEQCDDGNMSNTDACVDGCRTAICGDGFVQAMVEPCDDGNTIDTDACLTGCFVARCGDGVVQAGVEECDDGNTMDGDACPANCQLRDQLSDWYAASGPTAATYTPLVMPTVLQPMGGQGNGGDDGFATLALPFAFSYFGVPTTTLSISVNGVVGFDAFEVQDSWTNRDFPDARPSNGLVAVWWDDWILDPQIQGGADVSWAVEGTAPSRTLVIQWRNVRPVNQSTRNHRRFHFQLALSETTNAIQLRYGATETNGNVPNVTTVSVGLEDITGTIGDDLLGCSPNCDGRPRPPRMDGFPENSTITLTPIP